MNMSQLNHVQEIFSRLVDVPREQLDVSLDAACGSDLTLRREVESLLRHATPPDTFLDGAALSISLSGIRIPDQDDDLIDQTVGPYRLVEKKASGGMGTVYRAVRADGQYEQDVAIKLVKRGMDTEQILRHFARERQTLASLRHPNIAQLLDAGAMPNGRPYLVMEYVKGIPIDAYCDHKMLAIRQRLQLFCVVCEAVRFAHQKLVVHRDLKPGNILVDETGTPKLLDFGVSKVLGDEGTPHVTVVEERRFTPEYASPEQVSGQPLTTASDVYSLGIILFELLTSRRPYRFNTRSVSEIQRVVCEEDIIAPSVAVQRANSVTAPGDPISSSNLATSRGEPDMDRLVRHLRGDLDTIVLKATHKDAARRYASIEQLIGDIDRHLAGLPVMARPDTIGYRVQKFMHRHTVGVSLGIAAAILLAAGVIVVVVEGRHARLQRDAAYIARDQAEATADFLQKMISAADPSNEGPSTTVRSVLETAALRVDSDLKSQPLVQAAVRSTIGRTYLGLGMLDSAAANINAARKTRESLLPPGHHDLAESDFDLAQLYYAQGEYEKAESLLEQCLTIHQNLRGKKNLDTARVLNDLGAVRRASGKIDAAESALREALLIRQELTGDESLEVAETLNNLCAVMRARGQLKEARDIMNRVVDIRRRSLNDEHPLVLQSMANLAVIISSAGEPAAAEQIHRDVVNLDRKVYGSQHPALAVDLAALARNLMLQKRFAEAEPLLRESLKIRKLRLRPDDDRLLKTQATLGECLTQLNRNDEAADCLRQALAGVSPVLRESDPYWKNVAATLARMQK